jgi:hypothetical protein
MKDTHRFNLVMSLNLYHDLQRIAVEYDMTVTELIKRCIRLGVRLIVAQAQGKEILIREGDSVQKIILL